MKHFFSLLILISATVIFSCKNAPEKNSTENPNACTKYACPMHPDKTSAVPAKCPECNMEMEAVKDTTGKDSLLVR
jgi:hypothetical protein